MFTVVEDYAHFIKRRYSERPNPFWTNVLMLCKSMCSACPSFTSSDPSTRVRMFLSASSGVTKRPALRGFVCLARKASHGALAKTVPEDNSIQFACSVDSRSLDAGGSARVSVSAYLHLSDDSPIYRIGIGRISAHICAARNAAPLATSIHGWTGRGNRFQ
jgi:hypothetical protein